MTPFSISSATTRPIQTHIKQISITLKRDRLKHISLSTPAVASIHPRDQRAPRPPADHAPQQPSDGQCHPSTHLAARPATLHTRASIHQPDRSVKHHLCITSVRTPSASHHDEIPDPALPDDPDAHEPANEIPLHHDLGSRPTGAADFSFFITPKFGQK
ncbi:hypothetical protein ACLOJK_014534 [Asimina triloba]